MELFRLSKRFKSSSESEMGITDLPFELLVEIFRFVNRGDRKQLALVNRLFYNVARSPAFYGTLHLRGVLDFDKPPLSLLNDETHPFSCVRFSWIQDFQPGHNVWLTIGSSITKIEFEYCSFLTTEVLEQLLPAFPNLDTLVIASFNALSEDGAFHQLPLEHLRNLDVSASTLSPKMIGLLIEAFPNLRRVVVSDLLFGVNVGVVTRLAALNEFCEQHASLEIRLIHWSERAVEPETFQMLMRIKNLSVEGLDYDVGKGTIQKFERIAKEKTAQEIRNWWLELSPFSLELYLDKVNQHLPNMREFSVNLGSPETVSVFGLLSNLHQLEFLRVAVEATKLEVNDTNLYFPRLKKFMFLSETASDFSDESVANFTKACSQLASLTISHSNISEQGLQTILKNCLRLHELALCHLQTGVTDKGLTGLDPTTGAVAFPDPRSISDLKGLRELLLDSCPQVTNFSLTKAFNLQELRKLELYKMPNVNSLGIVAVLENCPSLESFQMIEIRGLSPLESLQMSIDNFEHYRLFRQEGPDPQFQLQVPWERAKRLKIHPYCRLTHLDKIDDPYQGRPRPIRRLPPPANINYCPF